MTLSYNNLLKRKYHLFAILTLFLACIKLIYVPRQVWSQLESFYTMGNKPAIIERTCYIFGNNVILFTQKLSHSWQSILFVIISWLKTNSCKNDFFIDSSKRIFSFLMHKIVMSCKFVVEAFSTVPTFQVSMYEWNRPRKCFKYFFSSAASRWNRSTFKYQNKTNEGSVGVSGKVY